MQIPTGVYSSNADYTYGYNGMEKDDELKGGGKLYSTLFREGDTENGRWWSRDPLEMKYTSNSPYSTMGNNPIVLIDPFGDDYVSHEDGTLEWDADANDAESTSEGDTYLGKELSFKFNSYIDEELWDGPSGPFEFAGGDSPAGDKLTSTITIKASENEEGELTSVSVNGTVKLGDTPIGSPRDMFEGLDKDQNKFSLKQTIDNEGKLTNFTIIFEQHASVSESEEFGLNILGYDIVNVAQRLELTQESNVLSIKAATDIFPSATLTLNNLTIMQYDQPSFENTHGIKKIQVGVKIPRNVLDDGLIPVYEYKYLRPKPSLIYHKK